MWSRAMKPRARLPRTMMRRFHFFSVILVLGTVMIMGFTALWGNDPNESAPQEQPHTGRYIYASEADNEANHCVGLSFQKCCQYERDNVPGAWIVLYVLILLYIFLGIAVICDDYFVPSLELLSERLDLSEDVAGATFMAAGSSAPELFTSLAGVTTESDVGVGTIVGSAVFNILVIIALTAALTPTALHLDWRPLTRDSIFYGLSIVLFLIFAMDGEVQYYESIVLLITYALYIVIMKFNSSLMNIMAKYGPAVKRVVPKDDEDPPQSPPQNPPQKEETKETVKKGTSSSNLGDVTVLPPVRQGFAPNDTDDEIAGAASETIADLMSSKERKTSEEKHHFKHHSKDEGKKRLSVIKKMSTMDTLELQAIADKSKEKSVDDIIADAPEDEVKQLEYDTEKKEHGAISWFFFSKIYLLEKPEADPESTGFISKALLGYEWTVYYLSLPLYFMYSHTIPECSRSGHSKYYVASFTLSIFWIACLTISMVIIVEKMGCILRLSVLLMGLLLVAAGTSIPDAMSSIIVARDGFADMAVSNAIGSNIFDINLGLGFPFLVKAIWEHAKGEKATVNLLTVSEQAKYDHAKETGGYYMVPHVQFGIILFGILIVTLATFIIFRFKLSRPLGVSLFGLYICFVIYGLLKEFVCTDKRGITC